ncbi:DUF2975 domain-containing protein [Sporosarcina sp. BI001-red]|uniref:DUF2975 domain-containing protein n=1 Tax=Sporosarcina sp. BI001-red TaxID=2282866 RepID=UPI000E27A6EB|nr:DUF2975 domain-containing protein [Sporosarcina sp. BI001-red]REB05541.1 DUF2975 domain-containing protein [Sporosarcina sp. BI001-red]
MKRETMFLKITLVIMAIPILALCIFIGPRIAEFFVELVPEWSFLHYPFLIGLYATALIYFMALYQTMKLLTYIDNNTAFSEASVTVLKWIKRCAILIGLFYVVSMPLLIRMAQADDAPGIIVIDLGIIFGCVVIAVFAAVLQKLLQNAIEIKSENELTV